MNGTQIPKSIFNSIEKVLRYLVPGLLFVILLDLSGSVDALTPRIGRNELYYLSPVFGLIVYVIHRIFFWVVDAICRGCKGVDLAASLRYQAERAERLSDILYYRWGVVHFGLILSELVFFFSVLTRNGDSLVSQHRCFLVFSSTMMFAACAAYYVHLTLTEFKLLKAANETVQPIAQTTGSG